jgi:hypothetical protein
MPRFLVCASCRTGLLALGAAPVDEGGTRIGSLLDRCETHSNGFAVQATSRLDVTDDQASAWRSLNPWDEAATPADPALVATIAGHLVASASGLATTPAETELAVTLARAIIVAASKGNDR